MRWLGGGALQERLNVPVTTGGAATVWTMFSNAIQANRMRADGSIGSGSPVGRTLIRLLNTKGTLVVDSKVDSRFDGRLRVREG